MRKITLVLLACISCNAYAEVGYQRLVNASNEPQNWLTYSGSYRSERFSPLTQINKEPGRCVIVYWERIWWS